MCDGDDEAHNQQVNPDELNQPQVTGMKGTTGKENPCPVEGNEQTVVGDDEPSPSRMDIINVNNNWNPQSKNAPADMQANPGQKETNMVSEVNLVSLGCFGPFPSTVHQGMTSNGPNKKGPNDRRSKRRRADSGGRSCAPIPNTGHPTESRIGSIPIDLNSNPRSNSSASEDSVIQETQETEEFETVKLRSTIETLDRKSETLSLSNEERMERGYALQRSSGSRVHVFCFDQNLDLVHIGDELELFVQLKPSLSTYAKDPKAATDSLLPLLQKAENHVLQDMSQNTSVKGRAIACLRQLGIKASERILQSVKDLLKVKSSFKSDNNWVTVLDGTQEGAYQWVSRYF
ncbi:hypothetical protein L2E82_44081 [Cichorium intybus]|uniref:Uncharacterized protein n=1 Tax=Cichorium intybus TaxID=13427 RepID=A0ACB8ZQ21_CICIN|nr:hypothetical protein L2E82_44081 [Cichorium intybus]